MSETKASEQCGATTNNAVLVAAIKIRRILDELDKDMQWRVIRTVNATADAEGPVLEYPGKQLELAG